MRWLLIYKGQYGAESSGPEIRYLRLGSALIDQGDQVIIAGAALESPGVAAIGLDYLSVRKLLQLSKQFFAADVVVLHGGGPVLMLLALLAGLFAGTRLVLDCYALHWIELHQAQQSGRRSGALSTHLKIQFNLLRFLYGLAIFDHVVVANQRQLDLARGVLAALGFLSQFDTRISIIAFGCDPVVKQKSKDDLIACSDGRLAPDDLVIAWLGGVWDWFDMDFVLRSFAASSNAIAHSKFIFFGLTDQRFIQLQAVYELSRGNQGALMNLPWVPMEDRLMVWRGVDLAVVWGGDNIENDYATRTRNFDCISAGVPIVQNWDDYWGPIIRDCNCGAIATDQDLAKVIGDECRSRKTMQAKSKSIMLLYPRFTWAVCATRFWQLDSIAKRRFHDRVLFLLTGLLLLPGFLILSSYDFVVLRRRRAAG